MLRQGCRGVRAMRRSGLAAVLCGVWLSGSAAAASYEATRARPLFSPTRRPPPMAAVAAPPIAMAPIAQPPAPPPAFVLTGVILGPGANVALLAHPGSTEATRVALGGRIDGWRVSEIRPRSVVLTLDDRSVTVTFPVGTGPLAAPQL